MSLLPTRFWVLKNEAGLYYTQAGPPYLVVRQKDAWRWSKKQALFGAKESLGMRAVRVVPNVGGALRKQLAANAKQIREIERLLALLCAAIGRRDSTSPCPPVKP